jgi:hypothetical protein
MLQRLFELLSQVFIPNLEPQHASLSKKHILKESVKCNFVDELDHL